MTHFQSTTHPDAQGPEDPDRDGLSNRLEFYLGGNPLTQSPPYQPHAIAGENLLTLEFTQPANRSAVIEASPNLFDWFVWDVPENTLSYPSTSRQRSISGDRSLQQQFFRIRLSEP